MVTIRCGPLPLMANYNEIKRAILSRRHLVVTVGRSQQVEEWEVHHRGKRKDREAEKRSSKEVRWRERVQEQDGLRPPSLSTIRWNVQGPIIVRGRVVGVGLVGVWGGAPYHHYGLARIGNSEVFFVLLSLLSFCFVIIIKYSRAQEGNQASYPHHHPSLLL